MFLALLLVAITLKSSTTRFLLVEVEKEVNKDCQDSEYGRTDRDGHGCKWYNYYPQDCGNYDDDDFTAKSLCCACKAPKEDAQDFLHAKKFAEKCKSDRDCCSLNVNMYCRD